MQPCEIKEFLSSWVTLPARRGQATKRGCTQATIAIAREVYVWAPGIPQLADAKEPKRKPHERQRLRINNLQKVFAK